MPGTSLALVCPEPAPSQSAIVDNTIQCFICFECKQDGQCEWFSCAYCHNPAHRKCVNSWACSQAKQLVYAGATWSDIQATLVVRCALCKQDSQFNDPDLSDLPDYFTQYLDSDSEEPDSVPSTPGTEPDDFTDLTWEPELDTMTIAAPAIVRDYTGTRCMACNIVNDRIILKPFDRENCENSPNVLIPRTVDFRYYLDKMTIILVLPSTWGFRFNCARPSRH